jgi:hypothetical protein
MSRRVLAWDRIAVFVVAVVLLALGAAVALWGAGQLTRLWAGAPDRLSTSGVTATYGQSWWRAVSIAAGAVLTLLGLWWLLAHVPRTHVGALRLPGSGSHGRLSVDGDSAVAVAADVLADVRGVRSATGRLKQTRGQILAEMSVTAGPGTDLAQLSAQIDAVSADLAQVLGRDDVRARVRVRIARRDQALSRVN